MNKIIYSFIMFTFLINVNLFAQIDSGLVVYYPFNGNANDGSGNGNNGTVNGAILSIDRFGNLNTAYNFNGINNYIVKETPSFSFNYNSSFSVSAWVKLEILNGQRNFVWYGTVDAGNFVWTLDVYDGNLRFGATRQQSDWYFAQVPTTSLDTNVWYNFVGVYNNRDILLYMNGIQIASNYFGYTNTIQSTLPLSIGAASLSTSSYLNFFKGQLDDIRVYNRALNQTDINQLYNEIPSFLKITVIPQGYYNQLANKLFKKDIVTLFLRQSFSPYSIIDSSSGVIDSLTFSGTFNISHAPSGLYNLVVKHKNCIETWSSSSINFIRDTTSSYNFTTSLSQAFGNNMSQVDNSPVRFGIFSGDVNQSNFIDLTDISMIDNDAFNFVMGNVVTDLTGNGFVDISDFEIVDNNAYNFISVITP